MIWTKTVAAVVLALGLPASLSARQIAPSAESSETTHRISVTWTEAPIRDVLRAFAAYSGRSIVPGSEVRGFVTADINDQPWDVALQAILSGRGLIGVEDEYGIIRVDDLASLASREGVETLQTRSYRLSYARATEVQAAVAGVLSERGSVGVIESTNTLVVTDVPRVHATVARLIGGQEPPGKEGAALSSDPLPLPLPSHPPWLR